MNNKECLYWGNCGVKLITESEGATQCNNQSNCSLIDDGFEYKRFSKFIPSGATIEESQNHICTLCSVFFLISFQFCCHFQNVDGPKLYSLIFPWQNKPWFFLCWTYCLVHTEHFFKGQRKPLVLYYIVKSVLV